jgi:hypothetical protein
MSAAVALLQGCEVAGIELFLDNGRLRYRAQPGAYTEDLKQRVGAHKAEIVAELSSQAAAPAAGDLIHWSSFTLEQRAGILPTIKAGDPSHIYQQGLSLAPPDHPVRDYYCHLFGLAMETHCCSPVIGRYCEAGAQLKAEYEQAVKRDTERTLERPTPASAKSDDL